MIAFESIGDEDLPVNNEILSNFGDDFEDFIADKNLSSDMDKVNGSFEFPDTAVLMSHGLHLDVANDPYEHIKTDALKTLNSTH